MHLEISSLRLSHKKREKYLCDNSDILVQIICQVPLFIPLMAGPLLPVVQVVRHLKSEASND